MANLQGYNYNRVLSGSPDWRHTINYNQTGRNASSATYSVTIGLQLTEGSFGYGSYVRARVTVGGVTSGWYSFTSSNSWGSGSYKSVTINITGNANSNGGTLPANVEWNCSAYATSPNFSVSGEFSVSTWNTAPYFTSGEQWLRIKDSNTSTVLNGYIPENISTLYLDWGYATDNEGGTLTYELQQQINDGGWTTIDIGSDRSHEFYIGSGNEGESRLFWVTATDNNGVRAASGIYSAKITKNTLTAGWITKVSDNIYYGTNSITINFTGGSNTNGKAVKYKLYSDTVQIYNQRYVTNESDQITIWKGGAYPSGPYIKFDDLKNSFKDSGYKGNLHIGLATSNDSGSTKYNSRIVWVDIRATPIAPSRVWISGGSALKTINGKQYYIPNGKDTITFSWEGGSNPLGNDFKYRIYQINDGNENNSTYLGEVNNSVKSYSVKLPKQTEKHTIAFRVYVFTNYGSNNFKDSSPVDIHYYNSPTLNVNSVERTASEANIVIAIKTITSISNIAISGEWSCSGLKGTLSNTQNNQTIRINPLPNEGAHSLNISYRDNSSLSSTNNMIVNIPANNSIAFINKYGLGVGGEKADAENALKVNGNAVANQFTNKGYLTDNTSDSKVGWWSRVASFKNLYRYNDSQAIIKFLDTGSGSSESIRGELTVRVKQQLAMGDDPYTMLKICNNNVLGADDFKLVEVSNTANLTDYELWVRVNQSYTSISFYAEMILGSVTMFSNQKLQQNLPPGRQINCTELLNVDISKLSGMVCYYGSDEGEYYGMRGRNNSNNEWIRTTQLGLLPFKSGGYSSLGTATYPFNSTYTKNLNGLWVGSSGNRTRNTIPTIGGDGVMEIGRYIDFHYDDNSNTDFTTRMEISSNGELNINSPKLKLRGASIPTDLDFAKYPNTNGYQKLPSGLIIQWGLVTKNINSGQDGQYFLDVAFPVVFPNNSLCVVATPLANKWDNGKIKWYCQSEEYNYYSNSNKYATFRVGVETGGGATTMNLKWIAIGY